MRTIGIKKTDDEIQEIAKNNGYVLIDDYYDKDRRRLIIQDCDGYKYDSILYNVQHNNLGKFDKSNPYTLENISNWLKLNNKTFKLNKNNSYTGSKGYLSFHCFICKDDFSMVWAHIITGHGCGVCAGTQVGKHHSLFQLRPDLMEEWDWKLNKASPKELTINSAQKVHWICKECGHRWYTKVFYRTYSGQGCSVCSHKSRGKLIRTSKEEILKIAKNAKLKVINIDDFEGDKKRIEVKCLVCQTNFMCAFGDIKQGHGCPECNRLSLPKRFRLSTEKLLAVAKRLNLRILSPEDYVNQETILDVQCLKCKNYFKSFYRQMYEKRNCPYCVSPMSRGKKK